MNVFSKVFKIKQEHIDEGDGSFDGNPLALAIREHTGWNVFVTGVNVYVFYHSYDLHLPDWSSTYNLKGIPHEHLCEVGEKMREWINDFEQAWNNVLYPDPVTLKYKDGVLDIKGDFIGAFDVKMSCDLEDDEYETKCECFVCEHNEWDIEIAKHINDKPELNIQR